MNNKADSLNVFIDKDEVTTVTLRTKAIDQLRQRAKRLDNKPAIAF